MDILIKQMSRRTHTRAQGKAEEAAGGTQEPRVPPRKSVSFKEEPKKKATGWFQKQFSRKMSGRDYDHPINDDMDYTAAIAAAAYIMHSLEEHLQEQHIGHERETPLMRPKSGRAEERRSSSKRFSGNITEEKSHERKSPAKRTPSIKGQRLTGHDAEADAWEKAELAKVKERYEKIRRKIDSWEAKKIAKAPKKLEKTESELGPRRKKALLKFREDMEYIDQIAGGARAQTKERRRNEENEVKEKANVIRKTGKVPSSTCPCF